MEDTASLLPEPFSEKNIDGSPITQASEGMALFRNSKKPDRRAADRRAADRRASDRRASDRRSGDERREPDYPQNTFEEETSMRYEEAPRAYEAPSASPAYEARLEPAPPVMQPHFDEPPVAEPTIPEPSFDETPSYDTERFEPPVDEKPGMIPNPMKMPPVKKKTEMDYDMDESDYGKADPGNSDDDYGYSFDDEKPEQAGAPPVTAEETSDYGYYDTDDTPAVSSSGDDYGYGSFDNGNDSAVFSGSDTAVDYDSDYGSAMGADDDYGSDYDSGSDMSSDYY